MAAVAVLLLAAPSRAAADGILVFPLTGPDEEAWAEIESEVVQRLAHLRIGGVKWVRSPQRRAGALACGGDATCLSALAKEEGLEADHFLAGEVNRTFPGRYQISLYLGSVQDGVIVEAGRDTCVCGIDGVAQRSTDLAGSLAFAMNLPSIDEDRRWSEYERRKSSPWIAAGLQLTVGWFFPGAGHIYAGRPLEGLVLGSIGLGGLIAAGSVPDESDDSTSTDEIGAALWAGTFLYGLIDSVVSVNRSNRRLERDLGLSVMATPDGRVVVGMARRF